MRKSHLLFLFSFVLFILLVVPNVLSIVPGCSQNLSQYIIGYDDGAENSTINKTNDDSLPFAHKTGIADGGWDYITGSDACDFYSTNPAAIANGTSGINLSAICNGGITRIQETFTSETNITCSMDIFDKGDQSGTSYEHYMDIRSSGDTLFGIRESASETHYAGFFTSGNVVGNITRSVGWHTIMISLDNGLRTAFVDGVKAYHDTIGTNDADELRIEVGAGHDGFMDNVMCWDRAIYGDSCPPPPPPVPDTTPPVITFIFPTQNSINNTWNGTISLQVNENVNITVNDTNVKGITNNSINFTFNYTGAITDRIYHINFTATDAAGNENSSIFNFTFDSTNPLQNISSPQNLTLFGARINFSAVYTDTNLFNTNITISCSNGINYSNGSVNIVGTNKTENFDIDASTLNGTCKVNSTVCDGHTAKRINTYKFKKNFILKTLKYEFNEGNDFFVIQPKSYLLYYWHDSEKLFDRYNFKFTRMMDTTDETFVVKSSRKIEIIKDSEYPGHVVIPSLNKWIDFDLGKPGITYEITRINDFRVEVRIRGDLGRVFEFNSAGDLNCVTEERWIFKPGEIIETFTSNVLEGTTTSFFLNVSINDSIINTSNFQASLTYNNTVFTPTFTNTSLFVIFNVTLVTPTITSDNISIDFFWNYNLSNFVSNKTTSDNKQQFNTSVSNQTIFLMQLSDCSNVSTVKSINFTFFDETTLGKLDNQTKLDITIEVTQPTSPTATRTYAFNFSGNVDSYVLCIKPENETLQADATIQYQGGVDFKLRTYYLINQSISSNLTLFNLYNINDSLPTRTFINLDDLEDNPVVGAFILTKRYYPGANVLRTVEIGRTDSSGISGAWLIPNEILYSFEVIKDGKVVFLSQSNEIISLENIFLVAQIGSSEFLGTFKFVDGLIRSLTFDNATKKFTYIWTDTSNTLQETQLIVQQITNYELIDICNNISTSQSGNLGCVIPGNVSGNIYQAKAFIKTGSIHSNPTVASLVVDFLDKHTAWGVQGVLFAIFIIFGLAALGSFSPGASLFMAILGLIFSVWFGLWAVSVATILSVIVVGFIMMIRSKT